MITRTLKDAEHPFVMITRSIISDSSLSPEAFRVLTSVLDQRDDWGVNAVWLQRFTGMSRRKVERALVELINLGYMTRNLKAPEGGRFTGYVYSTFEEPLPIDKRQKVESAPTKARAKSTVVQRRGSDMTPVDTVVQGEQRRNVVNNEYNMAVAQDGQRYINPTVARFEAPPLSVLLATVAQIEAHRCSTWATNDTNLTTKNYDSNSLSVYIENEGRAPLDAGATPPAGEMRSAPISPDSVLIDETIFDDTPAPARGRSKTTVQPGAVPIDNGHHNTHTTPAGGKEEAVPTFNFPDGDRKPKSREYHFPDGEKPKSKEYAFPTREDKIMGAPDPGAVQMYAEDYMERRLRRDKCYTVASQWASDSEARIEGAVSATLYSRPHLMRNLLLALYRDPNVVQVVIDEYDYKDGNDYHVRSTKIAVEHKPGATPSPKIINAVRAVKEVHTSHPLKLEPFSYAVDGAAQWNSRNIG